MMSLSLGQKFSMISKKLDLMASAHLVKIREPVSGVNAEITKMKIKIVQMSAISTKLKKISKQISQTPTQLILMAKSTKFRLSETRKFSLEISSLKMRE